MSHTRSIAYKGRLGALPHGVEPRTLDDPHCPNLGGLPDYLLLGNRLEVDLVRDHDQVWLVRRNRATSRWSVRNTGAAATPAAN